MPRFPHVLRLPSRLLRRRARRKRMATLLVLLVLCVLLVLPFYSVYKPPGLLIRYFAARWPDVLWRVDLPARSAAGQRKLVALTIDDAPSEHTRAILEVLHEYGARATFFVIGGQVAGREAVLRAAVEQGGHELANHGMHDEAARALADDVLEDQIYEVDRLLRQHVYDVLRKERDVSVGVTHFAVGSPEAAAAAAAAIAAAAHAEDDSRGRALDAPPRYFRPGSGFFSDRMRALVRRLGYRLVLGSVYPHDAQIASPWLNARHILSMLRPGAVVICHDRRAWTAPMLRKMLPAAIKQGYRFVTVTELLKAAEGGQ